MSRLHPSESAMRSSGKSVRGLLCCSGVVDGDGVEEADFLAEKAANLRIFGDEQGKMNRSLLDIGGGMLVVSNFTLCADTRHGRRPSFTGAAGRKRPIRSICGSWRRSKTRVLRLCRPVVLVRICSFPLKTTGR